jgi:hypothetical protein
LYLFGFFYFKKNEYYKVLDSSIKGKSITSSICKILITGNFSYNKFFARAD